ncbi:MAG: glycoside hydrolase family 32 protein [Acidobacteriia bacterium]|nr:glycoside hydrolase family 32 protein [Terriglobia bacterium]MYK11442.1 glycoside hydrolase family 32 protein [Terriglobia bacterium]
MKRLTSSRILPHEGGTLSVKSVTAALVGALVFGSLLIAQRKPSFEPPPPSKKPTVQGTKIPEDRFGIAYDDVFHQMHYDQPLRPQVHYTPITGQIGDATGLILYRGVYHLFYMYDEWSRSRRFNKSWGHAVSSDLVFWEQRPQILNTRLDNAPGSGSGIVDWNNTLGLQSGVEKTLVVFYTDYGRGTSIAFSRDAGKTWIRHKDNPVIPRHEARNDRDAKVFWYKPDQSWRLILYERLGFTFYKSHDLLNWERLSRLEGFHECPDFLEIPVDGDEKNKKWVLIDGDGSYRIGDFDGTSFTSSMENTYANRGVARDAWNGADRELYATQAWSHSYEGDGPFYQMGFMHLPHGADHDRTWSQQQIFPVELTLETIGGDVRLCRNPINAIKQLRYDSHLWNEREVRPGDNPLAELDGDVFEIIAEIEPGHAKQVGFRIRGKALTYSVTDERLTFMESDASLPMADGTVKLRMIVDRGSVEVYANQGEITFTKLFYPDPSNMDLELFSEGGTARIRAMEAYRLQSIWLKREQELGYFRDSANRKE